jgi:hypothetical protein
MNRVKSPHEGFVPNHVRLAQPLHLGCTSKSGTHVVLDTYTKDTESDDEYSHGYQTSGTSSKGLNQQGGLKDTSEDREGERKNESMKKQNAVSLPIQ